MRSGVGATRLNDAEAAGVDFLFGSGDPMLGNESLTGDAKLGNESLTGEANLAISGAFTGEANLVISGAFTGDVFFGLRDFTVGAIFVVIALALALAFFCSSCLTN